MAAAGMYIELIVAAIAAIAWHQWISGWAANLCFNVIIMAGLTTLLFNLNPLMKFDGYYIMCDSLDLPNLSVDGQAYLRYWSRRYLLGVPATLPASTRWKNTITRIYAWAALVWRVFICVSLTVTAATLLHGAGIVLAILAACMWVGLPAAQFARYFWCGKPGEQPRRLRFLTITGSAAAVAILVLGFVPWPGACTAPAIVEYTPDTIVRAASAGFVEVDRSGNGSIRRRRRRHCSPGKPTIDSRLPRFAAANPTIGNPRPTARAKRRARGAPSRNLSNSRPCFHNWKNFDSK